MNTNNTTQTNTTQPKAHVQQPRVWSDAEYTLRCEQQKEKVIDGYYLETSFGGDYKHPLLEGSNLHPVNLDEFINQITAYAQETPARVRYSNYTAEASHGHYCLPYYKTEAAQALILADYYAAVKIKYETEISEHNSQQLNLLKEQLRNQAIKKIEAIEQKKVETALQAADHEAEKYFAELMSKA